jgi:hypothetical protein
VPPPSASATAHIANFFFEALLIDIYFSPLFLCFIKLNSGRTIYLGSAPDQFEKHW